MIRSKALRESARGQMCRVVSPVCCGDNETVVLAHSPFKQLTGGGMGLKPDDIFGARACHTCHDWLDLRGYSASWDDRFFYFIRGMMRTWLDYVDEGLIIVKGHND